MAKHRVHAFARVGHGGFQIHLGSHRFLAGIEQSFHPSLRVIQRFVHIGLAFHGFTASGHNGFGLQGAQGFQGGRPLSQLRIARVNACFVFHQIA